jgi:hypothetical protein
MTFLNPTDSLRNLTSAMGKKEKFSYINVPKSSIVALSKNSENPFPANFAKNIISSLKNNDKRIMKAISHTLVSDIENGRHFKIGLNKNFEYYYSNVFEYFYLNNKDAYQSVIDFYIRNTPKVIVTLHDKKLAQRHFGFDTHIINVPYNNYHEKLDSVYAQLAERENEVDYCLLDCGVFGLALMNKMWDNLNISIIDTGKTLSLSKAAFHNSTNER